MGVCDDMGKTESWQGPDAKLIRERTPARSFVQPALQLFKAAGGSQIMKTFLVTLLQIAVVVAIAWLIYQFFPVILAPLVAMGMGIFVVGGVVSGGMLVAGVICLVLLVVVGVALFVLLGLLSPVWLPVLAVIGLVALLRDGSRKTV